MTERENSWWIAVLMVIVTIDGCLQYARNQIFSSDITQLQNQVRELRESREVGK